jgi:hypothetical protein
MSLVVNCPSCAKPVKVPEHLAGKKVRCPLCKTILIVPDAAQGEGEAPPEPLSVEPQHDPLADLASAATASQPRQFSARKRGWLGRLVTATMMLAALAGAVWLGVYLYKQHQQPVQVASAWEIQNKDRLKALNTEAAALADQGKKQEAFDKYDKLLDEFHRRALSDPEVIGILESARQARRLLADEIAKGRATIVIRKPPPSTNPAVAIATTTPAPATQAMVRADMPARPPGTSAPLPSRATPTPATTAVPIPLASTATAPSGPQDEAARLKQLFDALLQQGANALAAGEAEAALESLFDAKLVLDRRVKAKAASYNSPEHVALLHGLAIGYQLAEKPEKASPLFDENTPLDRACKADNASRQLLITRGFLDATQGYLAMRTVVRLTDYIKKYPNRIDSDLMDVLISALIKADERVQNRALMLDPAIKLYEQYNAKLEATRPGKKRWGVKWVSPLEYEGERGRREAALREWQRQRQIVDQYATQVKQAEKDLEAAKKGGVSARARTNAASEALAAVRRRMADAEKAAQEAKSQIPPVPTLTREDFKRLVAPTESEIARSIGTAVPPATGDSQTHVVSAQPLRLGGAEPAKTPATPAGPEPAPGEPKPAVFDAPVAAPASRRTFSRSVTGFAVAPDLILTTSVVGGARRVILEFPNALPAEGVVVRSNDELALIRVRDQTMSYLNLAEAFTGGPVQCPAYPDISIFGVNLQTLAGRANAPKDGQLTVALPKHPRIPGSPLIDSNANLVGVVTATREDPVDRLPAIELGRIAAFLAAELPKQVCATPRSAPIVQITATFER